MCCEALEKVSLLIDKDWRISRLLHVAKTGIFASVYANYDPKQWFFRQPTYYKRASAAAVERRPACNMCPRSCLTPYHRPSL